MGGRGLIDMTQQHDKQVKLLQTYFLNKQVTSSLHAAVVKADDRCTPLDLVFANAKELPTNGLRHQFLRRHGFGSHHSHKFCSAFLLKRWLDFHQVFQEKTLKLMVEISLPPAKQIWQI
jgi:hypothetical protein